MDWLKYCGNNARHSIFPTKAENNFHQHSTNESSTDPFENLSFLDIISFQIRQIL